MSITRTASMSVLSLVAAGAIGGGFVLAMGEGSNPAPVELRQVADTATVSPTSSATPTTTTTTTAAAASPTTTTAAPKATRTARIITPAPQTTAQAEPAPAQPEPAAVAPAPVEPAPVEPTTPTQVRNPPPVLSIPDTTEPPSGQHGPGITTPTK